MIGTVSPAIVAVLAAYATLTTVAAEPGQLQSMAGRVRMTVLDQATGKPVSCRVHLQNHQGHYKPFERLPSWKDHFCFDGEEELHLAPGPYEYTIERGPEYRRCEGSFRVRQDKRTEVRAALNRIVDLASEGWWSGDLHIHRPPEDIELLMKAEDLHVAPVITWWNASNSWKGRPLPSKRIRQFDRQYFSDLLAGEDERAGGALMYFNMDIPIDIAWAERTYPSLVYFAEQALRQPHAWIDIEKPFWWDVPVVLAHGYGDSIGLANNHCCRSGMLDNEAWGKPRNREEYPGPHGNGLWSQTIYYHILNSGIRIPPSAGSASGVLPNPVGYNRVYVYTGRDELNYDDWWENLRKGRCFVTNGPLIRAEVNGHKPGHAFRSPEGQGIDLKIDLTLDSNDPIEKLEIIKNGLVEKQILYSGSVGDKDVGRLHFDASGWFLIRVMADVEHTFRFASTGPYYVEIGDNKRPVSKTSVHFFLDWLEERKGQISRKDRKKYQEVMAYHQQAQQFWQDKLKAAKP